MAKPRKRGGRPKGRKGSRTLGGNLKKRKGQQAKVPGAKRKPKKAKPKARGQRTKSAKPHDNEKKSQRGKGLSRMRSALNRVGGFF